MRVWARAAAALLAATSAGVLTGTLLTVALPTPTARPAPGPVLESVTPAQLAAMGVRLEPTSQPTALPDWLDSFGIRLPSGIVQARDADAAVRSSTAGVRSVYERALTYATVSGRAARPRGPTVVSRLVWAVVGTQAAATSVGGLQQALWLVDARSGHVLMEVAVLAPAPPGAVAGAAGAGAGGGGP